MWVAAQNNISTWRIVVPLNCHLYKKKKKSGEIEGGWEGSGQS